MVQKDFESTLEKIRSVLVVGGIFGMTLQEGRGQVQFAGPLLPGKRLLVCLYSIEELTRIPMATGFKVIAHKRRKPGSLRIWTSSSTPSASNRNAPHDLRFNKEG